MTAGRDDRRRRHDHAALGRSDRPDGTVAFYRIYRDDKSSVDGALRQHRLRSSLAFTDGDGVPGRPPLLGDRGRQRARGVRLRAVRAGTSHEPASARDGGFTLIEVMLAMVLMLVVSGATLAVFAAMERGNAATTRTSTSPDQVRRHGPSPASGCATSRARRTPARRQPQQPIERARAKDLIFRSGQLGGRAATATNPQNLQRYRYCLEATSGLYVQRQTWTGVIAGHAGRDRLPRRRLDGDEGRSSRT